MSNITPTEGGGTDKSPPWEKVLLRNQGCHVARVKWGWGGGGKSCELKGLRIRAKAMIISEMQMGNFLKGFN